MTVRFSILVPVYNREKYVRQAIESVLSQAYSDRELIVVDDGSTDGSAKVIKSYENHLRFIQQENQGPEVARNTAAAAACGDYLVLLDSDDFLLPMALEKYDRVLQAFDSPPLIFGSELYYRDNQPLPDDASLSCPLEVLRYQDYLSKTISITNQNSKLVIRKTVFDQAGGFRKSTPQTFHNDDLYFVLKTGVYGPCLALQKPYTVAYRLHEDNSIRNVKAIADGILRLAWLEHQGQYPGGSNRRWDRYAIIGGRASTWAYRYCWRGGERKLALRLLLGTAPMVFAAVCKKIARLFRKPAQPIILHP
jgi:glycosyltransferase involved in cell wall biosynthesis